MKIVLNNSEYILIDNHRDCFDEKEVQEKLSDTDYFDEFDYIFGDYSYDKLRLKGFYEKTNKNVKEINNYDQIDNYIKNYCSYGCKYFILKKEKTGEEKIKKAEAQASEKN